MTKDETQSYDPRKQRTLTHDPDLTAAPALTTTAVAFALDNYEIRDEIGRGAMGVVFRARDLAIGREIAVKFLQEKHAGTSLAERFLSEARITGQLQHPGIPPVHAVGVLPDGRPWLAMKLIQGRTLAERLDAKEPLDVLGVFEGIARAVGYAHSKGVIHRDLKPANIMVGEFGEVQVMDWGLAKFLRTNDGPVHRDEQEGDNRTRYGRALESIPKPLYEIAD